MREMIVTRSTDIDSRLKQVVDKRNLKRPAKSRKVKKMDVATEVFEKGFAHRSIQKELNERV